MKENLMPDAIDPNQFRQVLGQFPTGVVVVTAMDSGGEPLGMTVGSFTSVSLDPPLVAFLPATTSSSWKALRESGTRFCVNVLGSEQELVCRQVAMRKSNKFEGIRLSPSPLGNPVIEGALAYIDCETEHVYDAGDHQIVIGRVRDLDFVSPATPLLFFRGGYGSFKPRSMVTADTDLVEQLPLIDAVRPLIEELSSSLDIEVNAVCRADDEVVIAASAGKIRSSEIPTRVGFRAAFVPPMGLVFAAFGDTAVRKQWLSSLPGNADERREQALRLADKVLAEGVSVILGHGSAAKRDQARMSNRGKLDASTILSSGELFNPADYQPDIDWPNTEMVELNSVMAPVMDSDGRVAFALTLHGPNGKISGDVALSYIDALRSAAAEASRLIISASGTAE
jgi:flavin reductase (DIM6/NTAB) family NADH-FMN oxidoreductase RutF/DNA-binding IclR family transcriptional regulator